MGWRTRFSISIRGARTVRPDLYTSTTCKREMRREGGREGRREGGKETRREGEREGEKRVEIRCRAEYGEMATNKYK
jgi:hypothetical protein